MIERIDPGRLNKSEEWVLGRFRTHTRRATGEVNPTLGKNLCECSMLGLCRLWPRLSDPDSLKICGVFQPLHSFAGPPQALAVFPRERMERSRIESPRLPDTRRWTSRSRAQDLLQPSRWNPRHVGADQLPAAQSLRVSQCARVLLRCHAVSSFESPKPHKGRLPTPASLEASPQSAGEGAEGALIGLCDRRTASISRAS